MTIREALDDIPAALDKIGERVRAEPLIPLAVAGAIWQIKNDAARIVIGLLGLVWALGDPPAGQAPGSTRPTMDAETIRQNAQAQVPGRIEKVDREALARAEEAIQSYSGERLRNGQRQVDQNGQPIDGGVGAPRVPSAQRITRGAALMGGNR